MLNGRAIDPQSADGAVAKLRQLPADEAVANPAFDVTPAQFISAIDLANLGSALGDPLFIAASPS